MPYKVIVADPSPSARKAAELALPAPEFAVSLFADGLAAAEAIRTIRPDAVLSAPALPSMDGYDLAEFVRAEEGGGQVALFLLRGPFEPLDPRKMARVIHDGVIQKPFEGEALAGLVRETIGRKKEFPSIPEETVLERMPEPARPPESVTASIPAVLEEPGALEARIRVIVREEIKASRPQMEKMAADVVSAEIKKVLVEELKRIDTGKI